MMDQLDQLDALIETELHLYGERQDAALDEMSAPEIEQYTLNQENRRENLTRLFLLQEIRSWIEHLREELRGKEHVSPDADPLRLLEQRVLKNVSETDLITSEILQKLNIWIHEIRERNL
jgi:hypothetical protein